jgi:pimeloyl-ACP methyl ester carboxylesterase
MDAAGRGASEWLPCKQDYDFSLYLADAAALLAHLLAPRPEADGPGPAPPAEPRFVDWIGTSMGGLVGMLLAAKPNAPIRRLVLNDVGPLVPWSALLRLWRMHYPLGARFGDLAEVEQHLREIFASFGPLDDRLWKHVAFHSAQALEDGGYVLAFDPAIMTTLNHARGGIEFGHRFLSGVDLWPAWDRLQCPTLVVRGGASDVLLPTVAEDMERRGPGARVVEFPGIGHAPWLMSEDQIAVVREFLLAPDATCRRARAATR